MKNLLFLFTVLMLAAGTTDANAQLLKKIGEAAKKTVERKAEQKTEQAVEKAIDKATDPDTYKSDGNEAEAQQPTQAAGTDATPQSISAPQQGQSAQMAWNKFDFVSGDEIIFEDLLVGERLGEFPSMWDLKSGNAEVANINDENCIYLTRETRIVPFMKEADYLPDVFTIEFDLYVPNGKTENSNVSQNSRYDFNLKNAAGKMVFNIHWYHHYPANEKPTNVEWSWLSGGQNSNGKQDYPFKYNDFNRVSISFNQRAMKVYLNEIRVVNIPRCDAPTNFEVYAYQGQQEYRFIKNIRIAKGAVPLYDRMISDGKFITYGITFDVGKSIIKPESMGEINRIVELMTQNPDLKFSVEGHTDSTGNATSNQTLSEARSAAIVSKLVEMGISTDRLTASGKGQNNPIADNGTDEGRAKNRRVEFVKI